MSETRTVTRPPSLLLSFVAVAAARLSLRFFGLRRTARAARAVARWTGRSAPRGEPLHAARRIAIAAALFPGRAVCLEQAVALYLVLRRYGHPAALRIGVQPFPFVAHAWIEVNGAPLFEGEATSAFVPFPEAFA